MKSFKIVQKIIIICYLAVGCSDPTPELEARNQEYEVGPSPQSISEGAEYRIECSVGYRWLDGSSLLTITCLTTGNWTIIAACSGMLV